jgi:hypothetical protein
MQHQRFIECRAQRWSGMVWLQSQIKVGMVFLAGTGVDQQLGLAEVFRARGVFAPATC